MNGDTSIGTQPLIRRASDFEAQSGSVVERLIFNHRWVVLLSCLLASMVLGTQATRLKINASFEKMIPAEHPYIQNYLRYKEDLKGHDNTIRIAVETLSGTIIDRQYLEILRKLNDEVFLIPGVDRGYMKSLWTPSARWTSVTEEGFDGGTIIPDNYDGSKPALERVHENIERSGMIGQLVAANLKSTVLIVPLLDRDPRTQEQLDYDRFNQALERLRSKYQSDDIKVHITGFAKIIGDLVEGLRSVLAFFAVSVLISAAALYAYTRCVRSSLAVVLCSSLAVLWLLGLLSVLGFSLDPYSVLVPFLIFAIGVSHGVQKMNGITQDVARGVHKWVAARYTFRRLFLTGLTALLADAGDSPP